MGGWIFLEVSLIMFHVKHVLKRKQTYRKGTPARKGLDKEMGMSGTDAFAPMVESKIKHAG